MENIEYGLMQWQRVWSRLPTFENIPAAVKPNKIATTEQILNEYTGAELIELALSNTDLFGNAELDPVRVRALDPSDVLAMYLNVRYNASLPVHLLPMRRAHVFSQANHLYGWYLLMSAILTKIYDQTYSTIDPHLKYRADQLARVIAQINYLIQQMTYAGQHVNPNVLMIGVATVTRGTVSGLIVFDKDQYELWIAAGRTVLQAWDHWQQFHTQPTI
jgi:hypothetical protein